MRESHTYAHAPTRVYVYAVSNRVISPIIKRGVIKMLRAQLRPTMRIVISYGIHNNRRRMRRFPRRFGRTEIYDDTCFCHPPLAPVVLQQSPVRGNFLFY